MKIAVEVKSSQDLVFLAKSNASELGRVLGIGKSYISYKLSGDRPWYFDEIPKFWAWLRERGVDVRLDQVKEIIGEDNVKIRRQT